MNETASQTKGSDQEDIKNENDLRNCVKKLIDSMKKGKNEKNTIETNTNETLKNTIETNTNETLKNTIETNTNETLKNTIGTLFSKIVSATFQRVDIRKGFRIESIEAKVPFVGLINEDNPSSGSYGGMSLVFFPNEKNELLICFGVGTAGLTPDEKILTKPGHRRRLSAIKRSFPGMWVKEDPADLNNGVPPEQKKEFSKFGDVLKAYDTFLYSVYKLDNKEDIDINCFLHHLFLYALEREWKPKESFKELDSKIKAEWKKNLFKNPTPDEIYRLLKDRHYVILQGPPGTGKTYTSKDIAKTNFPNSYEMIQFHPNTSYESFIRGIRPHTESEALKFSVAPGVLDRVGNAKDNFLLIIDEVNRADLSKVLGEAIYLLEPLEISRDGERSVNTPYPKNGDFNSADDKDYQIRVTDKFYILGTMNTSDRSTAILDFAVRRRFAFVDIWPDGSVIEKENSEEINEIALRAFDKIIDLFIEYADQEEFNLIPGHSYFLADNAETLRNRFKYELIPLLREYLAEGYLSAYKGEVISLIDYLDNVVSSKSS